MSLADTCGAVVVEQYYSRFHFYNWNTFSVHPPIRGFLTHSTTHRSSGYNGFPASCPRQYSFVRRCILAFLCAYTLFDRMVSELLQVVGRYVHELQGMSFVTPFSFWRGLYRDDGGPNRLFFTYRFCDKARAFRFLTDATLIRSQVLCDHCGRFMGLCAEPSSSEGFRWRCNTRSAGITCRRSLSIRDGSWFQQSNLTFLEILLLTHKAYHLSYNSCISSPTPIGLCASFLPPMTAPRDRVLAVSGMFPCNTEHLKVCAVADDCCAVGLLCPGIQQSMPHHPCHVCNLIVYSRTVTSSDYKSQIIFTSYFQTKFICGILTTLC
jgi:hypothetical protein